ncbi:MAG: DedA family protein [Anaerolineae bacterium]|nr:DedA family protein [Anaerolineae bacterium]
MVLIDQIRQFMAGIDLTQLASLGLFSYLILALLVAIEGPIATLLGAAAASLGYMNPALVFFAAAAGNLTADTLWYYLGYIGKLDWVNRFGQRLGVSLEKLVRLEDMLREHAPRVLFVSKLTVSPMIPALISTGLIRYPWQRWFPAVFAGEMIWTGSLVTIGYLGVQAIKKGELGLEHAILAGTVIFIGLIIYFGRQFLKKAEKVPDSTIKEAGDGHD